MSLRSPRIPQPSSYLFYSLVLDLPENPVTLMSMSEILLVLVEPIDDKSCSGPVKVAALIDVQWIPD